MGAVTTHDNHDTEDTDGRRPGIRTGRRPGETTTRETILAVARSRFADSGFDKTSVRAIAADSGVDAALVHHYFGTKRELFVAAIALPTDPTAVLEPVVAAEVDHLGVALSTAILSVWDSPSGQAVVAAFRSMIADGDTSLISTFLLQIALKDVSMRVDVPKGSASLRVNLVASQMSGVLLTRHVLKLEPLASMSTENVVAHIAPTVQHYLTGPLPR